MKNRQEKGLIFVLMIMLSCLIVFWGGTDGGFLKGANQIGLSGDIMNSNGVQSEEPKGQNQEDVSSDQSNYLEQDISITDSFQYPQEGMKENGKTTYEESAELVFLLNQFSYARSGSEKMLACVAAVLVLYLVVIGPISYFYLKKIGKMERLWLVLPVSAVLFGTLILLLGNEFAVTTPQMDVLRVDTPGTKSICYGVMTSPGDDTYRISFEETAESLQSLLIQHDYEVKEKEKTLILHPDYAFEKDYIQYSLKSQCEDRVSSLVTEGAEGITAAVLMDKEKDYLSVMLCYKDWYYIVDKVEIDGKIHVDSQEWKTEYIGMDNYLKEELHLHTGLSEDEEQILNFAWYLHGKQMDDSLHIAAITKECETAVKEEGIEMISYGLFFQ